MELSRRSRAAALAIAAIATITGGCAPAGPPASAPRPSPTPGASPPPIPDFNARVGSNRVAAEASLKVARSLYADTEYWEVFVRTTPPQLDGKYDPADPATAAPLALQVTELDIVMATESAGTIRHFGAGGVNHERAEIRAAVNILKSAFPKATRISFRIFYGEAFQHATATYQAGVLNYNVAASR